MHKNRKGMSSLMIGVGIFIAIIAIGGTGYAVYTQLGEVKVATETPKPTDIRSIPFTTVRFYVYNDLDKDAGFGADDVYGRIYEAGEVDWTGTAIEVTTDYDTAGRFLTFNTSGGTRLTSGVDYELVAYQGDGGTNLYTEIIPFTITDVAPDEADWVSPETYYMQTEGTWTDAGCDATNNTYDEDATVADQVDLNYTHGSGVGGVGGLMQWDCTWGQATSGAVLREPVLLFQESAANTFTDINDVVHIWTSLQSGSGLTVPTGDLITEFQGSIPIALAEDPYITAADSVVVTLKVEFEAVGSVTAGTMQMILDDLGDYRTKDTTFDVRSAAEIISFVLYA